MKKKLLVKPAPPPADSALYWERRLRQEFDRLQVNPTFNVADENGMLARLHRQTLVGLNHLMDAAVKVGQPDFLLRVLRQTGRVSGLEGPQVSVTVNGGTSESLPDFSHLSDAEIARLSGRNAAIETTAVVLAPPKKKAKSAKNNRSRA